MAVNDDPRRPVVPLRTGGDSDIIQTERTTAGSPAIQSNAFPHATTTTEAVPSDQLGLTAGAVNWLGSSYSGADIKVVAHLYGTVDSWEEIDKVEQEAAQVGDAIKGLERLAAFPILNPEDATARFPSSTEFVDAAGMTQDHPQKSAITPFYVPYLQDPQSAQRQMFSMAVMLKSVQEGLQDQVDKLRAIMEAASSTFALGTLQTLSVQSHREKFPVRALGTSYVKGYTRGPRTIAGSMIFTVFDEHALRAFITASAVLLNKYELQFDSSTTSIIPDQLPPIDLTIMFANEYGSMSRMALYGVEFQNDGVTFSIEDLMSEQVMSFVARDVDVMTKLGRVKLSEWERGMFTTPDGVEKDLLASELQFTTQDAYDAYVNRLGVQRRFKNR
jgi:hypothetical protein